MHQQHRRVSRTRISKLHDFTVQGNNLKIGREKYQAEMRLKKAEEQKAKELANGDPSQDREVTHSFEIDPETEVVKKNVSESDAEEGNK